MNDIVKLTAYRDWLRDLKSQIKTSQIKASLSVNSEMIMLYLDMGGQIVEKQEKTEWGSGLIDQLSSDLRKEFPDMKGFSRANLFRMQKFYKFYSPLFRKGNDSVTKNLGDDKLVAQLVRQFQSSDNVEYIHSDVQKLPLLQHEWNKIFVIPWGHNISIIEKTTNLEQALFYINKTIENNWSRSVLEYQIETNLYERHGKAVTNFNLTLPAPQSDLAIALMKDPYNFDFLRLSEKVKEAELEKALINHIAQFLPELGIGFAYLGRQYKIKVGTDEFRTDLLFYHTRLKAYTIIELKTTAFQPEFVGKLNFYITAIDELVKDDRDNPTIGILLCKSKNNYTVEFSLKKINSPIGVSAYHYTELTDDIKAALPSAEELQNELLNFEREHNMTD